MTELKPLITKHFDLADAELTNNENLIKQVLLMSLPDADTIKYLRDRIQKHNDRVIDLNQILVESGWDKLLDD